MENNPRRLCVCFFDLEANSLGRGETLCVVVDCGGLMMTDSCKATYIVVCVIDILCRVAYAGRICKSNRIYYHSTKQSQHSIVYVYGVLLTIHGFLPCLYSPSACSSPP